MQHEIPVDDKDHLSLPMARAIETCVHCGFCLPACPTYRLLGQEMDSPRGRIVLMKEVLEGELAIEQAAPHIDACLGCLACEPACPSGVAYRDLISPFRATTDRLRKRSIGEKARQLIIGRTLPYPGRLRAVMRLGRLAKPFARWFPGSFRPMLNLIPKNIPRSKSFSELIPARRQRRARVALLIGCAQQVLDPDINVATIDVLTSNGVDVVVPRRQVCCGALSWHVGSAKQAQDFAKKNLNVFPTDIDAIVTNAAGCGSAMREYGLVLKGTRWEELAKEFSQRVCDVSVFLDELGKLSPIPNSQKTVRVAYQDACHLSHGQGVAAAPRRLLRQIPGVELIEITDSQICCGSAGTYNLDQPEIAARLGKQKAECIIDSKPDVVASGNIGCIVQLNHYLGEAKSDIRVRHTMQILRDAYENFLMDGRS